MTRHDGAGSGKRSQMSESAELSELKATIDALAAQVRHLEDQAAIGQLVAQYGPAVDSGSADAAAGLWATDGAFEVPPYATWTGHEEIAEMVNGPGHQALIVNGAAHVLTAPLISVDGDEARAWNYALNIRWDPGHDRFWVARVSANRWRLRRHPGGWRITHRVNRALDGTPEPRALFRESTESG
jgi:hypothetical protein